MEVVEEGAPATCFFFRGRPLRVVFVAVVPAIDGLAAAEDAEVTAGEELSVQIPLPLPTDPVTVEEARRIGGEDEDISEEAIAVGIGGDRGIPMTLPPLVIPGLVSFAVRSFM